MDLPDVPNLSGDGVNLIIHANPEGQSRLMLMVTSDFYIGIELTADAAWTVAQALLKNVQREPDA